MADFGETIHEPVNMDDRLSPKFGRHPEPVEGRDPESVE